MKQKCYNNKNNINSTDMEELRHLIWQVFQLRV